MGRVTLMRIDNDLVKLIKREQDVLNKELGIEISMVAASKILANKLNKNDNFK